MTAVEQLFGLILAIGFIFLGYQVYLLPQRRPKKRYFSLMTEADRRIPFRPGWVWIYSVAYYPFILSLTFFVQSWHEYFFIVSSFFFLILTQVLIAFLFPVKTPKHWREYVPRSYAEKMLSFVQRVDQGGNCFPSMHVAVAVFCALYMSVLGDASHLLIIAAWGATVLISISTVLTKQHFVLDLPAGALHAIACFYLFNTVTG